MAVSSFLHYALEVPDQTVGQKYYQDFGLVDASGNGQAVRLKTARQSREAVQLYAGPRKRLHHLCYGAEGEDFAQTRKALAAAGVKELDAPRGAAEGGLWVRDPDGNLVNIRDEAAPAELLDDRTIGGLVERASGVAGTDVVVTVALEVAHDETPLPQHGEVLCDRGLMRLLELGAPEPQLEQVAHQHHAARRVRQTIEEGEEAGKPRIVGAEVDVAHEHELFAGRGHSCSRSRSSNSARNAARRPLAIAARMRPISDR